MNDVTQRLEALETRYSAIDDQIDAINKSLYLQQQQIDRLLKHIARLEAQLADSRDSQPRSLLEERPPHY